MFLLYFMKIEFNDVYEISTQVNLPRAFISAGTGHLLYLLIFVVLDCDIHVADPILLDGLYSFVL